MKVYQVHPLTAAIFFCLLSMGMFGIFVMIPIAVIQVSWNAIVSGVSPLPEINVWQASLLYLATATLLYLTGFVRVDFEPRSVE